MRGVVCGADSAGIGCRVARCPRTTSSAIHVSVFTLSFDSGSHKMQHRFGGFKHESETYLDN